MKLRYKILGGLLAVVLVAIMCLAIAIGYTADCETPSPVANGEPLMKAVVYRCYGSPDVLEYTDVEKPVAADDEILVKVKAAAVNPLDWHYMRGSPYLMRLMSGLGTPTDIRLGVDFSGVVESVGKNVSRFRPGDEVFGGANGAFAEYLVVREDRSIEMKPANVTFEEAAAVPIAALTALQALRDHGALQSGQSVLVNGASGGVGTYAVQIAKSMGAEVTGVCSTRNVEMVTAIGADHVIDYKKQNYTEGETRYDLIVDMVSNHGILANTDLIPASGALVIVGGRKGDWLMPLVGPLKALVMAPFLDQQVGVMLARLSQEDLAIMAGLMAAGEVRSVIDRRFPLAEVAEAIRYSESGRARGKIIINVEPDS